MVARVANSKGWPNDISMCDMILSYLGPQSIYEDRQTRVQTMFDEMVPPQSSWCPMCTVPGTQMVGVLLLGRDAKDMGVGL